MTGNAAPISSERLAIATLLEKKIRHHEVESRDVRAHADRLEILLRLPVGSDRSGDLPRLPQERRQTPLHLGERDAVVEAAQDRDRFRRRFPGALDVSQHPVEVGQVAVGRPEEPGIPHRLGLPGDVLKKVDRFRQLVSFHQREAFEESALQDVFGHVEVSKPLDQRGQELEHDVDLPFLEPLGQALVGQPRKIADRVDACGGIRPPRDRTTGALLPAVRDGGRPFRRAAPSRPENTLARRKGRCPGGGSPRTGRGTPLRPDAGGRRVQPASQHAAQRQQGLRILQPELDRPVSPLLDRGREHTLGCRRAPASDERGWRGK